MKGERTMRTNDVISNTNDKALAMMQAYVDSRKKFTGIKTVCADVIITDGDDLTVTVEWTATDGTKIDRHIDSGIWAGRTLCKLANIWGCEPTPQAVIKACNERTAEVMFIVNKGVSKTTGEPYEMQDFKKPNAIDRAHQRTIDLQESEV